MKQVVSSFEELVKSVNFLKEKNINFEVYYRERVIPLTTLNRRHERIKTLKMVVFKNFKEFTIRQIVFRLKKNRFFKRVCVKTVERDLFRLVFDGVLSFEKVKKPGGGFVNVFKVEKW